MKKDFVNRHLGIDNNDVKDMLQAVGASSIDDLMAQTIPAGIRNKETMGIGEAVEEADYARKIRDIASRNKLFKNYIGLGYYGTELPAVIQRNIFENPAWYTSYTPYQAEISQGRLEALINFQTLTLELTGMELANASLLDEATAAAEAMVLMYNTRSRDAVKNGVNTFFVDENVFPQTIDVIKTRCDSLGIELKIGSCHHIDFNDSFFGIFVQYPDGEGNVYDYSRLTERAHDNNIMVGVAADIMSLCLLTPPGKWDADVVVGSTQRFGVPLGYGGPHAAYFATREKFKRQLPGRVIGVSIDKFGNNALRMALQTREQHIKRERATSNICTAQALLATMASMYAIYHGPEGLKEIAGQIHRRTAQLSKGLQDIGCKVVHDQFFDTLKVQLPDQQFKNRIRELTVENEINLRYFDDNHIGVSLDETTTVEDVSVILGLFAVAKGTKWNRLQDDDPEWSLKDEFLRDDDFLSQHIFHRYHTETEMMRYIKRLEQKDFSLVHSMIPLGSCTMKLNAASEMMPVSWPEFGNIHPFAPLDQVEGYHELIHELANDLKKITGFGAVSFQPNSGASGEYTGLMVIREYHRARGDHNRNIALIPASAHGTNPASAVTAGMKPVIIKCNEGGDICMDELKGLVEKYKDQLAAFMVTYPSTHGVFEDEIKMMIDEVHNHGGLVYMDGANMNAQLGLTNPALIGADVCHLNLHKTFAIPHGGGGPGMGPIAVADHLVEYLPTHPLFETGGKNGIGAIAAAPFGSSSILPISYAFCKLLGDEGLTRSAQVAILNANYLAKKLGAYFPVLYSNQNDRVAHELIIDIRPFKQKTGISEIDVAKRLMDYGFHAPTVSFPVPGTLMVEPTESESKEELDRFIDAMAGIYAEIKEVEDGKADKEDNVLKHAPHTVEEMTSDEWPHEYDRKKAAYPVTWLLEKKFWPSASRVNDAHGDRYLICSCIPIDEYREEVLKGD